MDDASRMDEDELDRFIEFAADDLASPDLSFEPLLPDDEFAMERSRRRAGAVVRRLPERASKRRAVKLDDDAADALEDIDRIADVGGD